MNLYLINAPIGKRLVLGINKKDAIDRLQNCHGRTFVLTNDDIIPYRGTPETLNDTSIIAVNYSASIILRCSRCKDLACRNYELYCVQCLSDSRVLKDEKNLPDRKSKKKVIKKKELPKVYYPQIKNK